MSPKPPDPRIRTALIEAAARVLVDEGPGALTTRRVASEVGTSTMAVYTYFEGMDELKAAVCREGFERLAQFLDAVPSTDDPVTDVTALGVAYFMNAITNSHLYQFMFGEHIDHEDDDVGYATFETFLHAVERAVSEGRFQGEPLSLATQLWATGHGAVMLHFAGLLTLDEAITTFSEIGTNLFVGFGDSREAALASIQKVQDRLGTGTLTSLAMQ